MKAILLLGAALVLATSPAAFAQTKWPYRDGSTVTTSGGAYTHTRRGNVQYTYDSNGQLKMRLHKLGNTARIYNARGEYVGTAVAGPNGTTINWRK